MIAAHHGVVMYSDSDSDSGSGSDSDSDSGSGSDSNSDSARVCRHSFNPGHCDTIQSSFRRTCEPGKLESNAALMEYV